MDQKEIKFAARGVQVYYGDNHAIKDVDVDRRQDRDRLHRPVGLW